MTVAYIATAGIGLNLPMDYSKPIGVLVAVAGLIGLVMADHKRAAPAA